MDKNNLGIPVAIIIAGLLIAGAVMFGGDGRTLNLGGEKGNSPEAPTSEKIRPADKTDNLQGRLGTPVTIVEYSDLECPFCKMFHFTMKEVLATYNGGEEAQVSWVFRHFPLDNLHSKARKEAEAAECAGELGGNTAFWAYIDKVFSVTPSNNGLDLALLPGLAAEVGLNRVAFEKCLASGKHANKIEQQYQEATAAGGQGTPFVIVIGPDGKQTTLPGAVPLAEIKKVVDPLLK